MTETSEYSGVKITHNAAFEDVVIKSKTTTTPLSVEDITFVANSMYVRKQEGEVMSFLAIQGTTFSANEGTYGFDSKQAISLQMDERQGYVHSPGTEVLFVYPDLQEIRIDGVSADILPTIDCDKKVFIPAGRHHIELVPGPGYEIGTACDDGDSCTVNDVYISNCECKGVLLDTDEDGICDAQDSCINLDRALIGTACDDGDPTTFHDTYQEDGCRCLGIPKKELSLRLFLEGPYDPASGLMHDSLRQKGLLPLEDPYGLGATANPILLEEEGTNAVVDWIQVEVRDKVDPAIILTSAAMLLQRDGDLVTADGDGILSIGVNQDSAYLSVSHWNHLSLTTALPIRLTDTASIDFSQLTTAVYGGQEAGKEMDGIRMLIAGDANGDGSIDEADQDQHWRLENGTSTGYGRNQADFNLDGVINIIDKNEYWWKNEGNEVQRP